MFAKRKDEIHVLLVSSKYMPEYSGSGYRAHNLYKRLLEKHSDVTVKVLCGSTTENGNATYEHEGLEVTRIAHKPFTAVDGEGRLRRTLRIAGNFFMEHRDVVKYLVDLKETPDVVHVFGENYVIASALDYARKAHVAALVEICNETDSPYQYVPFPNRLWVSPELPERRHFVCISEKLRKMALRNGVHDTRIWCRPNPVDEARFKPCAPERRLELRRKLSKFDENHKLLTYVAKYRPSKNHEFLFEVLRRLPDDYRLLIKGPLVESGPLAERDQALFAKLKNLAESPEFAGKVQVESGFCDNVEDYYRMADAYVFPSKEEGLGTPVLECVACGVPIVSNRIEDTTDVWVKDDENGYLSSLDPDEFAEKIVKANSIPTVNLRHSSESIIAEAGTDVIDEAYYQLLKELATPR